MKKTFKTVLFAILILVPAHAFAAVNALDSNKVISQNSTLDHSVVVKKDPFSDLESITEDGS